MEYEVTISYHESGINQKTTFRKDVNTLEDLKKSFLKRFGNITEAPNKALKEKPLVKELTYSARSLPEWVSLVNTNTRWELAIRDGSKRSIYIN